MGAEALRGAWWWAPSHTAPPRVMALLSPLLQELLLPKPRHREVLIATGGRQVKRCRAYLALAVTCSHRAPAPRHGTGGDQGLSLNSKLRGYAG